MSERRCLLLDERGTETVRWSMISGIIVGGLVLTVFATGVCLNGRFDDLRDELES